MSSPQNGSADLTAIKDVATSIGKGLKKFDVVALNPSVPPGTTEENRITNSRERKWF